MRIAPRDAAWAARLWPRCCEGLDPVATYGPEVLDTQTHPGDRYWAIVEPGVRELGQVADEGDIAGGLGAGALDEETELGMAWANRYENCHMWTYGLAFFPEHRRQAKGQGYEVSAAIQAALFSDPKVSALVTLVYSSNPAAMRYNGLRRYMGGWQWAGMAHRRLVGHIEDAAGPGIHLFICQTSRRLWEQRDRFRRRWLARAERPRRYRQRYPEKRRALLMKWELRQRGLSVGEYEAQVVAQAGACAICGNPPTRAHRADNRLNVDHDHGTGANRGLLCNACNLLLGKAKDDPAVLRAAAEYIEKWRTRVPAEGAAIPDDKRPFQGFI